MSLVGTRPILQDELRQYELHHRARIAIKPGITGMWQVSGRSDITDFEEVVRLDVIMMVPFSAVVMWTFHGKAGNGWNNILWLSGKIAFGFSLMIEMLQLLLRLGTFQLSDIFYNTVGGVLGGMCYWGIIKIKKGL